MTTMNRYRSAVFTAQALLQSRGESASVFGPGREQRNLTRDSTVKALGIPERAEAALQAQAPDISEWIEGYAAGYNHYLAEHPEGVGSWCDQAEWVQPVNADAFIAQYLTLVQTLPRASGAIVAARRSRRCMVRHIHRAPSERG